MTSFLSRVIRFGRVELPKFTGIRVMMMPFALENALGTLPSSLAPWAEAIGKLADLADAEGIGYLTIDEAYVRVGETHRRPGTHVDGVGEDGSTGGWGGGGYAGREGMLMVSSHVGCRAWHQRFRGIPGLDGDCAHLADQCEPAREVVVQPNEVYWCSPLAVHEAIPMTSDVDRQFCRISMPSAAPWYEGYTPNPLGIMPTGPIRARRPGMEYRP